jgi:hypothetical protein
MIVDFIVIILISLFVFYPDRMIPFSHTSLGRLLAISLIVYYTKLDRTLGLFLCLLTIYYYQQDNFEHMLNISEGFLWDMTLTPYEPEVYKRLNDELLNNQKNFRETHCSAGILVNKGVPVKIEMAEHVFPEIEFDGTPCNPCASNCKFSILSKKLKLEEELIRPKDSNDTIFSSVIIKK